MSRWQMMQAVVLLCSALSTSACDDVLEGKEDEHEDHEDPSCCASGGGSHGGGIDPDEDEDPDVDDVEDGDDIEVGDGDDADDTEDRDAPVVEIESGELVGSYASSKVRSFLGIPYAEKPTGELRFLAPQPASAWSKPRKATQFAASCIQSRDSIFADQDQDEDCLYLNVWAPARTPKQGLPVFVWFHGGDHASGSASEPLTKRAGKHAAEPVPWGDGTSLAQRGMVVVSVNYRLGPLGFLAHKQIAKAEGGTFGNQGLRDQQLALRWVQENVAAFGGNSDNVTIAGQGSGASDVCLHVVAKDSQGLFAHVVQQSGGCTTYQPTAVQLQGRAEPWLSAQSCEGSDLLGCLQDKSVEELYTKLPHDAFVPCVDGDFLSEQPRHLFDRGEIADVSFLMGSNAEEASVYFDRYPEVATEGDYHSVMQQYFPAVDLKELCEVYPHERFVAAEHPYQLALAHVLADGHVVCSTLDTAIRAQQAGANVYLYNFAGPSLEDEGDAEHGAELPYVFGTLSSPDSDEAALSTQMQSYWTEFARSGDPDDGSEPTWPALRASKTWRMNLSSELSVLKELRTAECELWSKLYDSEFGD